MASHNWQHMKATLDASATARNKATIVAFARRQAQARRHGVSAGAARRHQPPQGEDKGP